MNNIFEQLVEEQSRNRNTALGVAIGVVTNINDPEKKNRVKVKIMNRANAKGDYETDFIFVSSPMAGKECGIFFHPEVNDVVLVAFIDGDASRPIVISRIWSTKNTSPVQIDGEKNDIRMIKSRGGNIITLDDTSGKEKVTINTVAGTKLELNDEAKSIALSDKDGKNVLNIDIGGGKVSLNASSEIVLKAGAGTITINNSGVKIDCGSGNLEMKGTQVKMEASAAANVKATGQLNLESSAMAVLKGSMVKIN